jgi:putative tryptophan/tyrosine transport system substrate-binding protein
LRHIAGTTTLAHLFRSRLAAFAAVVCLGLAPAPAAAKPLLLMQEGIALYETVTAAIAKELVGAVDIQNVDVLRGPEDLGALVDAKAPEALVVVGLAAARLVAAAKVGKPAIFCLVPQRELESLKSVNGTGVVLEVPLASQLTAVRSVLPKAGKLGVLYNPKMSGELIAEARHAASTAGVSLVEAAVEDPGQLARALEGIIGRIDAVWMLQDRTVGNALGFKVLLVSTLDRKVPLIAYSANFVESGALVSMAPDFDRIAQTTVGILKKVLAGAAPGSIPWHDGPGQLVINSKVAARLGINLPASATKSARLVE